MEKRTMGLVACFAALLGACDGAGAPVAFDFESASRAERDEWMRPRAEAMAKGFNDGLNRNAGLSFYKPIEPVIDPVGGRIVIGARVASSVHRIELTPDKQKQIRRVLCTEYQNTDFHRAGVRIEHKLLQHNGALAFSHQSTPHSCSVMLARG